MRLLIKIVYRGEPKPKKAVKHRLIKTAKGSFVSGYQDKDTRCEMDMLKYEAAKAMGDKPPSTAPISIDVRFYRRVPTAWSKKKTAAALNGDVYPVTRPDIDNMMKLVADSFSGVVWMDDSQIVTEHLCKRFSETPRTEVIVYELGAVQTVASGE